MNGQEDPNQRFSVTVETKNLLKFLASYSIAQTTIFCESSLAFLISIELIENPLGLCPGHCAIFYVYVGDSKDDLQGGVLTFFVPAFNVDGDD